MVFIRGKIFNKWYNAIVIKHTLTNRPHMSSCICLIKFISSMNLGLYIKNRGGDIENAFLA